MINSSEVHRHVEPTGRQPTAYETHNAFVSYGLIIADEQAVPIGMTTYVLLGSCDIFSNLIHEFESHLVQRQTLERGAVDMASRSLG